MRIEAQPVLPNPSAGDDGAEPTPGKTPDRRPEPGPAGPRTPYPVDDPGVADPDRQPGATPDVVPGRLPPGTRM